MTQSNCAFCQKLCDLEHTARNEVVWSFPHSVALLGPWQFYHGYCILIARRHATELNQLPNGVRRDFFDELCLLASAVEDTFQPHKLNYELLGNQVPHLHWHLFPRYRHDPDYRKPVWLALDRAERDEAERKRMQTGPSERAVTLGLLRDKLAILTHSD
jgi:diadenosine tetraphosphate (Ap4A) HIT family hydrolase